MSNKIMHLGQIANVTLTIACTNEKIILYKIYEESCNSQTFQIFIKDLCATLENPSDYFLYLDNVPFHKNNLVIETLRELNLDVIYAVNNFCILNPCEYLFSLMKQQHYRNTHLSKSGLKSTIKAMIENINESIIKCQKSFVKVYQNILQCINFLKANANMFKHEPIVNLQEDLENQSDLSN